MMASVMSNNEVETFLTELVSRGHVRMSEWPSDLPVAVADLGLEIDLKAGRLSVTEPIIELDIPFLRDVLAKTEPSLNLHYSRLVSSTNTMMVDFYSKGNSADSLFLCEFQYEGRGRRGKTWRSPYASTIMFSLGMKVSEAQKSIKGLSCALGLSIAHSLISLGISNVSVKWPNDVYIDGRKVCGILVELVSINSDSASVVIGVGLNYRLKNKYIEVIDKPTTDLISHGIQKSRSQVLRRLVEKLCADFRRFTDSGFSVFRDDFNGIHWLADRFVEISQGSGAVTSGIVAGVSGDGELLLRKGEKEVAIIAGEISLIGAREGT
jgi:BirA family biotin operon repressor/biotin-[acetyl-CoA-carboxylase] ligase